MVRKKQSLECVLMEKYTVAPAPSRDYFGIKADISYIYLYHWRISRLHKTKPLMQQIEIDKFSIDSSLHDEIEYIFGTEILSRLLLIAKGKGDCFCALPHQILVQIFSFLTLRDIGALACTCKKMSKMVTKTDAVWKQLYMKHYPREKMSRDEKTEVSYWGWHKFFKKHYMDSKGISSLKTIQFFKSSKIKKTMRPATALMNTTEKKKDSLLSLNVDIRPKTSCVNSTNIRTKVPKSKSATKVSSKTVINNDNKTIVKATSNLTPLQLPSSPRPKTSNPTPLSLPPTPRPKTSNPTLLSLPPTPRPKTTNPTSLSSPRTPRPKISNPTPLSSPPTHRPKTSNPTPLSSPPTPRPISFCVIPGILPSTSSSATKKSTLNSPKTKPTNTKGHSEVIKSPRVNSSLKSISSPRTPTKYDLKSSSTSKLSNVLGSNTPKSPRLLNSPR